MTTASEMHEQQKMADKQHHEQRLAWLAEETPKFSCGTPVPKHEALQMRERSIDSLRLINDHGMVLNHASI